MNKGKEKFIQKEMVKQFTQKVALNKVTQFLSHPERCLGKKYIRI